MWTPRFKSKFYEVGPIGLPKFSGTRVMMLPFLLEDVNSLPDDLAHYCSTVEKLCSMSVVKSGVAYLTIDEKTVKEGAPHRRGGLHVDGVYRGRAGAWGAGGSWGYNGLLTVSNVAGCRAWRQVFEGKPGDEGECSHLRSQCEDENSEILKPNVVYWLSPFCVHESLRQTATVERIFIRLSMPSNAPWFEGYTENPKGIRPTGPILPRRNYQKTPEVKLNN